MDNEWPPADAFQLSLPNCMTPKLNRRYLWTCAATAVLGVALISSASAQEQAAQAQTSEPVEFASEVAPLLIKHCHACHGSKNPEGEYQVHSTEAVFKPGASESPPITPGKPDESELIRLITSTDPDERMPKEADPLSPESIETIRRWIAEGAKHDATKANLPIHAIVPRPVHPQPPEVYPTALPITAMAFAPSGEELAVSGYHEVAIWKPDGTLLRRLAQVAERTYALAYSADGVLLAVAGGNPGQLGEVKLLNSQSGEVRHAFGPWPDAALDLAFSPDGTKLAVAGADRTVRIFDVTTGNEDLLIEAHADWVTAVAWSADGARIATGSRDKTAKVFDAKTGSILANYPEHDSQVYDVLFTADGSQVLSSDEDKEIHYWKVEDGKKVEKIARLEGVPFKLTLHGEHLLAALSANCIRQYVAAERKFIRELQGHSGPIYAMAVHGASGRIASGDHNGQVRIWNLADGASLASFVAMPGKHKEKSTTESTDDTQEK